MLKALDITKVKRMAVHATSRTLAYSPSDMAVMLESEANSCNSILPPVPVKPLEWKELPVQSIKAGLSSNEQFNYFSIIQSDGKEHHLRSMKLDRILKWINFIAKV